MTHYHRSPGKCTVFYSNSPWQLLPKCSWNKIICRFCYRYALYRAQKGKPILIVSTKNLKQRRRFFSFSNGLNSTFPFSIVLSNFLKFCCHCFYVFFERRWWYGLFVRDDVDNSVWSFGWPGDRYMGNKYSLLSTYNYFRLKTPPEPIHLS